MLAIVLFVAIAGCTTIEERHGVAIKQSDLAKLGPDSTKNNVMSALGSPSTKSLYGQEVWYYISNDKEQNIVSDDDLLKQEVYAIYFDENGRVNNIELYSAKDSKKIAYQKETTPTAGHELTVVEQLLGNIGRFTPAGLGQQASGPPGRN